MRISYDSKADALYIRFVEGPIQVVTERLTEDIAVNYSPDRTVVGIEVLDATQYVFGPSGVPKVVVENLSAEPA